MENNPVADANVFIEENFSSSSDINGRFTIPDITANKPTLIRITKNLYEPLDVEFIYSSPSQVFYVHLYSGDQLLSAAETAIKDHDWVTAEAFLDRAEKVGANAVSHKYLKAVIAVKKGDAHRACELLEGMATTNPNEPFIFLFLGDIYQYSIGDNQKAREYLVKFLTLRGDPDVEARVKSLSETDIGK